MKFFFLSLVFRACSLFFSFRFLSIDCDVLFLYWLSVAELSSDSSSLLPLPPSELFPSKSAAPERRFEILSEVAIVSQQKKCSKSVERKTCINGRGARTINDTP
jgi:hypothetical protein